MKQFFNQNQAEEESEINITPMLDVVFIMLIFFIGANNDIWIDRRMVDVRSVRPNIERLHAENPQGSVVIQADKESKTDTLIQVMDASRQAGVFNVSIAAQEQ